MWPVFLLVAALALVNSQKWPDSDLGVYYSYITYVAETPLSDVLLTTESFSSITPEVVVFKVYVWLVAVVGGASGVVFTVVSSLLIYGVLGTICHAVLRSFAAADSGSRQGSGLSRLLGTIAGQ